MFGTVAIASLAGVASWTFAEYAIHNWYGHKAKGRNEFSREHLAHHARYMYFAPWTKKARAAAVAAVIVAPLSIAIAGVTAGIAYAAGFIGFYAYYEWLHLRAHTHAPIGAYGRWMRKHHFFHHFGNPKHNHGVTTPIWDLVFRTYTRPDRVRVPRAMAMPWLTAGEGGELRPEYAGDYALAGAADARPRRAG